MKIAMITGSRSDRNALQMVEKSLRDSGHRPWEVTAVSGRSAVDARDATSIVADSIEFVAGSIRAERPDIAMIHGDRHEILGAAVAANIMGVPIGHIGGGDITEGSQDDSFRHSITKLSHLHFAANEESAGRILQMGEESHRVHVTGCPGIDMVVSTPILSREKTFGIVGLLGHYSLRAPAEALLVLFHPNTLGDTHAELKALSDALMDRPEPLVLLGPNADVGSELIRQEWQTMTRNRPHTVYYDNVEPQVFYSLLKHCNMLIGNSSAGFYEAPCFGTHVFNIGDRQEGRAMPSNVRARRYGNDDKDMILAHIIYWMDVKKGIKHSDVINLYGDGHASERIAKVINEIDDPKKLLRKVFSSELGRDLQEQARALGHLR